MRRNHGTPVSRLPETTAGGAPSLPDRPPVASGVQKLGHIIGWAVAGLLVPARRELGVVTRIVLGVVAVLVGGFVGSALFGPDPAGPYIAESAWPGLLAASW